MGLEEGFGDEVEVESLRQEGERIEKEKWKG